MGLRTQITQVARARGLSAALIARRLGLYRSNLSAMDAGRRRPSLSMLVRIAELLDVSPGDLLRVTWGAEVPIFRSRHLNEKLLQWERSIPDGSERGWVHKVMLAWLRHYRKAKRQK